jgi:hypothetical protein
MKNPPPSLQNPPETIVNKSILDMDQETLAKEFEDFSFIPTSKKIIYASNNSDPLQIDFKTLSKLSRDQTDIEIKSVKMAFQSLATSVQKSKINEIEVRTRAIPVQVKRLYEDLNKEIKKILSSPKYQTLNTDPLAKIFIEEENSDKEIKAIEALATLENPKKNIDKAKLSIYGQLIDKIEGKDSDEIKTLYDKILDLKFKEVTLKKFLPTKKNSTPKIGNTPQIVNTPLDNTPTISQPKEPTPLSILLQTSLVDGIKQQEILAEHRDMPAESIFPIIESNLQQNIQDSKEPPLPPQIAKLAMVFAQNKLEREALEASQAKVIKESRRLESELNQLKWELDELENIKQQNTLLHSTELNINIVREEELRRALEEKQAQENRIKSEAFKIEQELKIQEALQKKQDGKIPGLRPREKPKIVTDKINPPTFEVLPETEVPWDQKYLANLRGEPYAAIEKQQLAPDSLLSQGPYSPPQTLSGLQALGAESFALTLGAIQPPKQVQDLLSSEKPLASAQNLPQYPQSTAPFNQVASPKQAQAKTSSIFTQAHPQVDSPTFENHNPQITSDVDQLLEDLSAEQLLGEFQFKDSGQGQDLASLPRLTETEKQILELQQTQPDQALYNLQDLAGGPIVSTFDPALFSQNEVEAESSPPPPPPVDSSLTLHYASASHSVESLGEILGDDRFVEEQLSSQDSIEDSSNALDNQTTHDSQVTTLSYQNSEPSSPRSLEYQLFQLQHNDAKQTEEELGSAPLQNDPPPPSQNQFQALSTITSLGLDKVVENPSPTIFRTEIEKIDFLQNFISTRLISTPRYSNNIQSSPRTIDVQEELIKDQLNQPQSSPTISESDNDIVLPNTISSISYLTSEIEEIEKRKKILYAILQKNLTNQRSNEKESNKTIDPSDAVASNETEDPKEEIIDTNVTKANIETVMNHIATYTSNLASSILKVKNGQEETPEASAPQSQQSQSFQNSSTDDPIIYSGIGIRIKLENENEECFLKITEIFKNSGLDEDDVNKKITHIEYEGNLKLISDIYKECGNNDEIFYTKIAVIFRDSNKETLNLKIEGEDQQRDVKKNIFIPSQRNIFNISDNSQLTKIAYQINARRANQNSTPLSSPRDNTSIST